MSESEGFWQKIGMPCSVHFNHGRSRCPLRVGLGAVEAVAYTVDHDGVPPQLVGWSWHAKVSGPLLSHLPDQIPRDLSNFDLPTVLRYALKIKEIVYPSCEVLVPIAGPAHDCGTGGAVPLMGTD